MVNVVLDADFLSAFLKIEALDRVRDYFRAETLLLPPAVFREVAVTTLFSQLVGTAWLEVREVTEDMLKLATAASSGLGELGAGEREAIALAYAVDGAVLLMNDRVALRHAGELGIRAVSIPAFLLLYRSLGVEAVAEVPGLVEALEQRDHYGIPEEIRRRLLADRP
jgi:predicted nucleic acid-binding protein